MTSPDPDPPGPPPLGVSAAPLYAAPVVVGARPRCANILGALLGSVVLVVVAAAAVAIRASSAKRAGPAWRMAAMRTKGASGVMSDADVEEQAAEREKRGAGGPGGRRTNAYARLAMVAGGLAVLGGLALAIGTLAVPAVSADGGEATTKKESSGRTTAATPLTTSTPPRVPPPPRTTQPPAKPKSAAPPPPAQRAAYFGGGDPPALARFLPRVDADGTIVNKPSAPVTFTYEIVAEYPHDPNAFTQGLLFDPATDTLLESTGMYGDSELREVNVTTGRVLRRRNLARRHFGEGLDWWHKKNALTQLTWRTGEALRWDRATFKELRSADELMANTPRSATLTAAADESEVGVGNVFRTPLRDGWGLASDGGDVVYATDSSDQLYELEAESLGLLRQKTIRDGPRNIKWLNEIELVNGLLLGQIWQTDCMAVITPDDAKVVGWADFRGLGARAAALARGGQMASGNRRMDVFNGVAYDPTRKRLLVTGKYWPTLFDVRLVERPLAPAELEVLRTRCIVR